MLTLEQITGNQEEIIQLLEIKHFQAREIINTIMEKNDLRKKTQSDLDHNLAQSNQRARDIAQFFREGNTAMAEKAKKDSGHLKERIKILQSEMQEILVELRHLLTELPNIPHNSVVKGQSEEDNEVIKTSVNPFEKADLPAHWDICKEFNIIDFESGNTITGSGFPLYRGQGARLQRALISFFLEEATKEGYKEYMPPLMVNAESAFATGQLPDKDAQMYYVKEDDFYLIPTAEVPLTNIYYDRILSYKELPLKLCAYTPCFRREAGSYGKNVRGLNRLHQFDKVEIVQITHPEKSYATLENMCNYVESLIQKLELPYRILKLCGKDLSFTSALTYDFEVYSAGQKKWLEVSSVSNFLSFQSNRLKLRIKDQDAQNILAHTLNGSALALPRIVAALLENNYVKNKGIEIPEVLWPYLKTQIIEKECI
jgi:seryl-tRNA synthetase